MKRYLLSLTAAAFLFQLSACQHTAGHPAGLTNEETAGEWVLIHEFPGNKGSVYILPSSIEPHPANIYWRSFELMVNIPTANRPSSIADYIVDCQDNTYLLNKITFYTAPYGLGTLDETFMASEHAGFSDVSPDKQVRNAVFSLVCTVH